MESTMTKYTTGYLYQGTTVVLEKSQIKNAKEEDFQEITLLFPIQILKDWYVELDMLGELDEEDFDEELEKDIE